MTHLLRPLAALLLLALAIPASGPAAAQAQGARVEFGGLRQDPGQPVEVTADSLTVNQADGTALFEGNVVAVQGELRLGAAAVRVEYAETGGIARLTATGGVTLASATDAAEAREAVYEIATGTVTMTGDVLLTQGRTAISGQRLVLDLEAGTGRMEGRVQTVFTPGGGTVRN
ncbi:MAG TPA: lipopolysaccharide transport periplasmic protein LptA [Paracoccaceae bacterium]|nr:lipopolysaccharide transport periplasmic protein LptA [Paracoccaceae bacterium]HMO73000.1 lipopolysaccharide transport periplasmic protein LptA [Paracoccaceae bacterium]